MVCFQLQVSGGIADIVRPQVKGGEGFTLCFGAFCGQLLSDEVILDHTDDFYGLAFVLHRCKARLPRGIN